MSEYQYYEFQAIDRPLTREEMTELRSFSSRARISPSRFTNEYHWGDFKGINTNDKDEWLSRMLAGDDPTLARDILKRHRASSVPVQNESQPARTADVLLSEADDLETERIKKQNHENARKGYLQKLVGKIS